jgi:hypothetical protein
MSTIQTIDELQTAINSLFPDNNQQIITPAILRQQQDGLVCSVLLGGSNPGEFVYVKGDADTDGSLRLTMDNLAENVQFEFRALGVWNLTGIEIAQSSVFLGRELKLSGAGEFLQTTGFLTGDKSVIPRVPYTDDGTELPLAPMFDSKVIKWTNTPLHDTELLVGGIAGFYTPIEARLNTSFYIYIGTIPPVVPLKLQIFSGIFTGLIYEQTFPASMFPANTEVELPFEGGGFQSGGGGLGAFFFMEATEDIAWTVGRSVSPDVTWFGFDYFGITESELLAEEFVLSEEPGMLFTNDGELVYKKRNF